MLTLGNVYSNIIRTIIFITFIINTCYAQKSTYSNLQIKYDFEKNEVDKQIPFDRPFTLVVEKFTTKKVIVIHAYEAKYREGVRKLVENRFKCNNTTQKKAVKDIVLDHTLEKDVLRIYFDPLKPNKDFDVNIISNLSNDCRNLLMKVNMLLANNEDAKAEEAYKTFYKCTIDKVYNRTYTNLPFKDYKIFYSSNLSNFYNEIKHSNNFKISKDLTIEEYKALNASLRKIEATFEERFYMMEALQQSNLEEIQNGLAGIHKVYYSDSIANPSDIQLRHQHLKSNIVYFEKIRNNLDKAIIEGVEYSKVNNQSIDLNNVRKKILTITSNLIYNFNTTDKVLTNIANNTDTNNNIKQGVYLAANNKASDLKTAGSHVLFLDAGIANMFSENIYGNITLIPKLYWGISVYFRSIDKNTKRNTFKKTFTPARRTGCEPSNPNEYGPDYGIVARRSILQHLSFNIGVTLGAMQQKEYDNFHNSNSILLGPAYRFARGFKVSAGLSLLRRTSKNPLVSEKTVIPGGYVTLSTDIDFIQGLKDVTSILFK